MGRGGSGGNLTRVDEAKVLIVTDDWNRGAGIARAIALIGLRTKMVRASDLVGASSEALVVLDRTVGTATLATFCRRVRAQVPTNPILVLTREADSLSRAILLENGANQVLSEPFCGRELLACVWGLTPDVPNEDARTTTARISHSLKLTPTERLLLDELRRAQGQVVEMPQLHTKPPSEGATMLPIRPT